MFVTKVKKMFKKRRAVKQFGENSIAAKGTVFFAGASCRNSGASENVTIDENCTIGGSFIVLFGGKVSVGKNTYIGPGTSIQAKESITIGRDVIIANNVVLVDNNNHPVSPLERKKMSACSDHINDELWSWKYAESKPIIIEDNVWIGRDTRILKGVTIGKGSIVALGAIVTHDVPPYSVVAGNPARVVKTFDPLEEEK